jgi:hypothetical protein
MKTKSSSGLKVNTGIKAGGLFNPNHISTGLRVKTSIKAGGGIWQNNHNVRGVIAV